MEKRREREIINSIMDSDLPCAYEKAREINRESLIEIDLEGAKTYYEYQDKSEFITALSLENDIEKGNEIYYGCKRDYEYLKRYFTDTEVMEIFDMLHRIATDPRYQR